MQDALSTISTSLQIKDHTTCLQNNNHGMRCFDYAVAEWKILYYYLKFNGLVNWPSVRDTLERQR